MDPFIHEDDQAFSTVHAQSHSLMTAYPRVFIGERKATAALAVTTMYSEFPVTSTVSRFTFDLPFSLLA